MTDSKSDKQQPSGPSEPVSHAAADEALSKTHSSDDEEVDSEDYLPAEPVARIKAFLDMVIWNPAYKGHDSNLLRNFTTVISASHPNESNPYYTSVIRAKVDATMANSNGNMHGGMTATIFDNFTSATVSLQSKPNWWMTTGVTRNLNVQYLRAADIGDEVDVMSEVVSIGRRFVCIKGTMTRVRDGKLLALCMHDKVNTDPMVAL